MVGKGVGGGRLGEWGVKGCKGTGGRGGGDRGTWLQFWRCSAPWTGRSHRTEVGRTLRLGTW